MTYLNAIKVVLYGLSAIIIFLLFYFDFEFSNPLIDERKGNKR